MTPAGARPRRPVRALAAAAAAVLALAAATAGPAAAAPTTILPSGSGITGPAGVVQTPDGELWVADEIMGVCRVRAESPAGLVETPWCSDNHAGPVKALQMAFDGQYFYVAEGASQSSGVWRLRWNAATRAIDGGLKIAEPLLAADRAEGLALGPGGQVFFSTKRSTAILRISGANTGSPSAPEVVGHAALEAPSLAWLGGFLYLAEPHTVTRLVPGGSTSQAVPVDAFLPEHPGGAPSAVAADLARNRLYAGTSNGNLLDQVDVLNPATGLVETYERGFAGVTGMTVGGDGTLYVADDPREAAEVFDAVNGGRLFSVPLAPLNRPVATIDEAPGTFGPDQSPRFHFRSRAGTSFECRLDGGPWNVCGGTGEGDWTASSVAEGAHAFEVRARDPDPEVGFGEPTRRTFFIDLTPPRVGVDNPDFDRETTSNDIAVLFSGSEPHLWFQCNLDATGARPCTSPQRYSGLPTGAHSVQLTARDLAGNRSNPADAAANWSFRLLGPPPVPGFGERVAAAVDLLPRNPVVSRTMYLQPRLLQLQTPRMRRREIAKTRRVRAAFNSQPQAKFVRVQILRRGARRSAAASPVYVSYMRPIQGGMRNRLNWRLSKTQVRKLRPGRYSVGLALGSSPHNFGRTVAKPMTIKRRR